MNGRAEPNGKFAEMHQLNLRAIVARLSGKPHIRVEAGSFVDRFGDQEREPGSTEAGLAQAIRKDERTAAGDGGRSGLRFRSKAVGEHRKGKLGVAGPCITPATLRAGRNGLDRASSACAQPSVSRENGGGMTLQELRITKRDEILYIAARHGARNVRLFGSVARGENDARSVTCLDFLSQS